MDGNHFNRMDNTYFKIVSPFANKVVAKKESDKLPDKAN